MKGKGWYQDSQRHSLAARGIKGRALRAQATILNPIADQNVREHISAKIEMVGVDADKEDIYELVEEIDETIKEWKLSQRMAGSSSSHRIQVLINDMVIVRNDMTQYHRLSPEERMVMVAQGVKRMNP